MSANAEVERRRAVLLKEINAQQRIVREAKSKVAGRKPYGAFRSMIHPIKSLTEPFGSVGSETELRRAQQKIERLEKRIEGLDDASTVKGFPEVLRRLQELRQYIVHNIPLGQGGDVLTMLAAFAGLADELESAEEQMMVLIEYGREFVKKYYKDAGSCALGNLDAEIRKHERDLKEMSRDISRLEKEGPVLTKSIAMPLKEHLRLLEDVSDRLKAIRRERNTPTTSAQGSAKQVAAKVHEMAEAVTLLEKQCEDDVRKYPDQAAAIRRRYRKAIDAILEKA